MKLGNFSNAILKRSVYSLAGSGKGNDKMQVGNEVLAYEAGGSCVSAIAGGTYAIFRSADKVCAKGATPVSVCVSVGFPKSWEEKDVKELVRRLEEHSRCIPVRITNIDVYGTSGSEPVITASCTGTVSQACDRSLTGPKPGDDIILTKWIGIEGVRLLGQSNETKILKRFTESFYNKALGRLSDMSVAAEAAAISDGCVSYMYPVGEGGILAALWNMTQYGKVGLDVDLKAIPVHQEVIEVCELLGINIYELSSFGCLLMTSESGCDIIDMLHNQGIEASIIGRVTDSNDKIIRNEDEVRYLDTPKRDEIYRMNGVE